MKDRINMNDCYCDLRATLARDLWIQDCLEFNYSFLAYGPQKVVSMQQPLTEYGRDVHGQVLCICKKSGGRLNNAVCSIPFDNVGSG